jgi:CBS domain-containing membrane protein
LLQGRRAGHTARRAVKSSARIGYGSRGKENLASWRSIKRIIAPRRSLLERLSTRFGERKAMTVFAAANGALSAATLALIYLLTNVPFIFPSVGSTVFHLFARPMERVSTPRNVLLGHMIGGSCGLLSLALFGLVDAGFVLETGMSVARVLSVGLAVALSIGAAVYLDVEHPPATATTLMFSLGFMSSLADLGVLMVAVASVTIQAMIINRRAGFPYPLWRLAPHLVEEYHSEAKRGLPQEEA